MAKDRHSGAGFGPAVSSGLPMQMVAKEKDLSHPLSITAVLTHQCCRN